MFPAPTLAVNDRGEHAVDVPSPSGDGLSGLGLTTRLGIHAGEVEVRGDDISGIAVHLAETRRVPRPTGRGPPVANRR